MEVVSDSARWRAICTRLVLEFVLSGVLFTEVFVDSWYAIRAEHSETDISISGGPRTSAVSLGGSEE
jgi:hypothetical protein